MTGIAEQRAGEGEKSRETIRGVDIAFEDLEREIVEAAEGPGRDHQKARRSKRRALEKHQDRRKQTQKEEQKAFGFDPGGAGQVFHVRSAIDALSPHRNVQIRTARRKMTAFATSRFALATVSDVLRAVRKLRPRCNVSED